MTWGGQVCAWRQVRGYSPFGLWPGPAVFLKLHEHKPLHSEAVIGSVDRLQFVRLYTVMWITVAILELIHAANAAIFKITVLILEPIHATKP